MIRNIRRLSSATREKLTQEINSSPVVVFMKGTSTNPQCGFSKAVCQILTIHNVKFNSFNVLDDPERRSGIKELSEWPTIPQVYVSGQFVGGCDILLAMHQNGELDEFLVKEGILVQDLSV